MRVFSYLCLCLLAASNAAWAEDRAPKPLEVTFQDTGTISLGMPLSNGFIAYDEDGVDQITRRTESLLADRSSVDSIWGRAKEAADHRHLIYHRIAQLGPSLLVPKVLEDADMGLEKLLTHRKVGKPEQIRKLYVWKKRTGPAFPVVQPFLNDEIGKPAISDDRDTFSREVANTDYAFYDLDPSTFETYLNEYEKLYERPIFVALRRAFLEDFVKGTNYNAIHSVGGAYTLFGMGLLRYIPSLAFPFLGYGGGIAANRLSREDIEQRDRRLEFEARLIDAHPEYVQRMTEVRTFLLRSPFQALRQAIEDPEVLDLLLDPNVRYVTKELLEIEYDETINNPIALERALFDSWGLNAPDKYYERMIVRTGILSPLFRELAWLTRHKVKAIDLGDPNSIVPGSHALKLPGRGILLDEDLSETAAATQLGHELWHSFLKHKIYTFKCHYNDEDAYVDALTSEEIVAGLMGAKIRRQIYGDGIGAALISTKDRFNPFDVHARTGDLGSEITRSILHPIYVEVSRQINPYKDCE